MVQRVFRQAFAICSNRSFLAPAVLVAVALVVLRRSVALPYAAPGTAPDVHLLVRGFLSLLTAALTFLSFWPGASLLSLAIAVARGRSTSLVDCWVPVGVYLRLVVVTIAISLVAGIGCLLLVVPGIFALVVWSQAWALMVDGRASFFDALEKSQDLTRGSRGDVFATLLCSLMLSAVVVGVGFAVALHGALRVPSWPMTLLSALWGAPLSAFGTALSAALYVDLLAVSRPLTRAEFFLAPTEAELPH
jgi:hypothetical protein